jgi:hypothetical protein
MTDKTKPPKNRKTTPKKEAVLTREEFFKTLDRVIQPVPSKAKPPKKETKGTSE